MHVTSRKYLFLHPCVNCRSPLSDISYPGPSLKVLELLQQEQFRKDIIIPNVMNQLLQETVDAAKER
jgi:hypothetical protein